MVHYRTVHDRQPMFNAPGPVIYLLAALWGVHLVRMVLPGPMNTGLDAQIIAYFAFTPARFFGDQYGASYLESESLVALLSTFVTHTFLHADFMHLGLNSIWLLALGSPVARYLGTYQFFTFYFVCGVFGALAHLVFYPNEVIPMVGASGAISGLMGGAIRFIFRPRYEIEENSLGRLGDPRLIIFVAVWFAINIFVGIYGLEPGAEQRSIAVQAHLGGFVAGLILLPFFPRKQA